MIKWLIPLLLSALIGLLVILQEAESCNEAVCGSVVSKCLLTQSCKCDRKKDCTCCKDCSNCLSYLYTECCSCVDMCPKPNDTGSELSKKSYVEDFEENVPGLFKVLTEYPDENNRWNSTTFPVDIDISQYDSKKQIKIIMVSQEQETLPTRPNVITLNCTVAYWSECMSWTKCKNSCLALGSKSYRWFHDGCCECVGENCINYGINESRCRECPRKDESADDFDEEDADYGEDEDYEADDKNVL